MWALRVLMSAWWMYIIVIAFAGLMSVTAQQLDYLHTALRALDVSSQNQYLIRGQPRFDKVTPDPLTPAAWPPTDPLPPLALKS